MFPYALTCLFFSIALALSTAAGVQSALAKEPVHTIITADAVEWKAAPASLPAGAQAALLYGDPTKLVCNAAETTERLSHSAAHAS